MDMLNRKRGFEAHLPARGAGVLFRLGAEGFELALWPTLRMTRRVVASTGSRS